eukprot:797822-Amphidinium_carterae.1
MPHQLPRHPCQALVHARHKQHNLDTKSAKKTIKFSIAPCADTPYSLLQCLCTANVATVLFATMTIQFYAMRGSRCAVCARTSHVEVLQQPTKA